MVVVLSFFVGSVGSVQKSEKRLKELKSSLRAFRKKKRKKLLHRKAQQLKCLSKGLLILVESVRLMFLGLKRVQEKSLICLNKMEMSKKAHPGG